MDSFCLDTLKYPFINIERFAVLFYSGEANREAAFFISHWLDIKESKRE